MTRRQRFILLIGLTLVLQTVVLAQLPRPASQPGGSSSQPGAGTRRNFTLYGDLKLDEAAASEPAHTMFDVILYTLGNEVFGRQRVGNGGRYRFNNVFNGDYYLAVELDNVEVARVRILIPANSVEHIKQDLEFKWKAGPRAAAGVVSAADLLHRSNQNRSLYEKAMKEIGKNELPKATATLRSLVEADPKDFPAWNELGMVHFIQKDLEAAAGMLLRQSRCVAGSGGRVRRAPGRAREARGFHRRCRLHAGASLRPADLDHPAAERHQQAARAGAAAAGRSVRRGARRHAASEELGDAPEAVGHPVGGANSMS